MYREASKRKRQSNCIHYRVQEEDVLMNQGSDRMKYEIIIVGGGPAGIIGAVTARKYHPEKNILLIKSVGKGVIPCAIPYMFKTMETPEKNLLGNASLEKNKIEVKVAEIVSLDKEKKEIKTSAGEAFNYEKLVLATGSEPIIPPIPGIEKQGIYTIKKDLHYLERLKIKVEEANEIVIVGGGFIGLEMADELSEYPDKKITIVEFRPRVLENSFDKEFSDMALAELEKKGVKILTEKKVVRFKGEDKVEAVELSDGEPLPCQLVILGTGAKPNSALATTANLKVGEHGGVLVDEYLRTSDENIFAIGDCSEKKDFFTRKSTPVMLASTATAEARIAGSSLYELKVVRENKGTIAVYSTKLGNLALASAGLTEERAKKEGFEYIIGNADVPDKHPGSLPNMHKIRLKLLFSKESGLLLGGQVSGGESIGELINIIALAIQKETTLTDLETLQVATHPKLTAAPTTYPVIVAAQNATRQRN